MARCLTRYVPTFEESPGQRARLNRGCPARQVPRQVLRRRQDRVFAVGDFEPAAVLAITTSLAELKKAPTTHVPPVSRHSRQAVRHQYARQGQRLHIIAHAVEKLQVWTGARPDQLLFGAWKRHACGTACMNRACLQRASSLSVSSFEPSASWTIYAITPPSAERLEKYQRELARNEGRLFRQESGGINALLNYRDLARTKTTSWPAPGDYLQRGRTFGGQPRWTRRSPP